MEARHTVLGRHTETRHETGQPTLLRCLDWVGRRCITRRAPSKAAACTRKARRLPQGKDNHWRSSYRQAVGRKRKELQREERPAQGSSRECCYSRSGLRTPGHDERALGVAGGRKRTRSHRRDNEDHGPQNGSRRLGAPTPPSRSGARQHQRTTAVPLRYSARQDEKLR
jgi:hypothetical protein